MLPFDGSKESEVDSLKLYAIYSEYNEKLKDEWFLPSLTGEFELHIEKAETSQKLLEVEKWSPEGDNVALRNSTFIRRFEPTGRPPWMTLIVPKLSGKFQPAKLA